MTQKIVVCWDSPASASALTWAMRHRPDAQSLEIVNLASAPSAGGAFDDSAGAVAAAQRAAPAMRLTMTSRDDWDLDALADRTSPDVLVAFSRGEGASGSRARGSAALRVVLRSKNAVAVVPDGYRGGRNVVVAVTGRRDEPVVLAAAAEAHRMKQGLVVLHAKWPLFDFAALPGEEGTRRADEDEYLDMFRDLLRGVHDSYPRLRVAQHVVRGRPSEVLLGESRGTALLVLARELGRTSYDRRIIQSSLALSRVPVLVVP